MSGQSSSHDTYRPFMIQSGSLTEAVHASNVSRTNHQQHPHIPRKKPSRPTLPSAIMSYDDRATWWSAQEEYTHPGLPETAYSCSSHGHDFGHSPGSVAWRPVWNEEYEEALRSDAGSMFSGRFHHQDIDGEASYSEMTHASHTTSTDLLHHAHTPSRMDDDLKQLWDVASTLLTRPPSTLSHNIDMNSVKQPERRQRVTFGWGRMGKPPSPSPSPRITTPNDKEYDPESIAQGIVECAEVGMRASTATALTWRGLLPSPRQTARGETPLPKSSTIESFSEKEESLPAPKARCRWWILALCIIVWAIGVTCIVLGVLVWKKGAKWF
jgi:hypothetical protein